MILNTARPSTALGLFNFGKKKNDFTPGQGTANKGTYVPEGLTPEQYQSFLKAEEQKKASKKKKFPKGKKVETLTEWLLEVRAFSFIS